MTEPPVIAQQIAALPLIWDKSGKLRVLMVTSRDRGRWVMPKGWEMDGKKPWHAAEIEALEEAGALGTVKTAAVGHYHYEKWLDKNERIICRVTLYPMFVSRLKRNWKERKERKRHWFSLRKAARLVEEEELARLLRSLANNREILLALKERQNAA